MTPFHRLAVLGLVVALSVSGPAPSACAQASGPTPAADDATSSRSADRAAVRQAALDYVAALYEVDSTRIVRSVHPDLVKYGYHRRDGGYHGSSMDYGQLKRLAATWNRNERRVNPERATKEVVVFEVLDKTASAKVVASWGTDYMHLVRTDGRWKIRQILWQSPPPSE